MLRRPNTIKGSQIDSGISVSSSINSHLVLTPALHRHLLFLSTALDHAFLRQIQGFPVRGHTHPVPTGGSAATVAAPANYHERLRELRQPAARTPSSLGSSGRRCHREG